VTFNTKISTDIVIDSPILTSQTISNARITCKQQTGQSQLRDSAINHQGIEMVSIWQIYCTMHQKLHNLPCQTCNFVTEQSCSTKLCNFFTCLDMGVTGNKMLVACSTTLIGLCRLRENLVQIFGVCCIGHQASAVSSTEKKIADVDYMTTVPSSLLSVSWHE